MGLGWVGFRSFTVRVLSFGVGMCNLVDLLMVKGVASFLRNWLLLGMPMSYGVVVCVRLTGRGKIISNTHSSIVLL